MIAATTAVVLVAWAARPAWAKTTVEVTAPAHVAAGHGFWVSADGGSDNMDPPFETCLYLRTQPHGPWVKLACATARGTRAGGAQVGVRVMAGPTGTVEEFKALLLDPRTGALIDTSLYGASPTVVRVR